ncbi:hypothetical protein D3C87_1646550 [compost metagenome]
MKKDVHSINKVNYNGFQPSYPDNGSNALYRKTKGNFQVYKGIHKSLYPAKIQSFVNQYMYHVKPFEVDLR